MPQPSDFKLTNRPTHYHINGSEGDITLYCWILDDESNISFSHKNSRYTIRLDLTPPAFSLKVLDANSIEALFTEPVIDAENSLNYLITPHIGNINIKFSLRKNSNTLKHNLDINHNGRY